MHCVRFEMRLNQLLDNRAGLDSDLELLEHARECPECGELLAGQELMLQGVGRFCEPAAGPEFAVRIAAEMAKSLQPTSRWASAPGFLHVWRWTIPAIAASALIALGLWQLFGGMATDSRSPVDSVVQSRTPPRPIETSAEKTDPYRRLYSRTEEWRQQFSSQRMEWVEQMADGLKPVADSMSAALHALRRTFPGGDSAVRSSQSEPLPISGIAAIC